MLKIDFWGWRETVCNKERGAFCSGSSEFVGGEFLTGSRNVTENMFLVVVETKHFSTFSLAQPMHTVDLISFFLTSLLSK